MDLLCPRCLVPLQGATAQDLFLHACPRCGGLWLNERGAARVDQALTEKALALADAASRAASAAANEARYINCPVCTESLIRSPIGEAGVIVDRCPEDGTWYDRDELQKIGRALQKTQPVAPSSPPPPPKTRPRFRPPTPPAKAGSKAAPTPPAKKPAPASKTDTVEVVVGVVQVSLDLLSLFL